MTAETLSAFHRWVDIILVACTFYQIVFFAAGLFLKEERPKSGRFHRYAVMIAARNEQAVIAGLIESLKAQTYPGNLLDIYVMSDRSTDDTAETAGKAGAIVFERKTLVGSGKGYVLHELWQKIRETGKRYDGFFIFDADNRAKEDFVENMDAVFSQGHPIVVGKRNATNFGANWISGGYALWFLREGIVNKARTAFGSSCPVTGTGYLVSSAVLETSGGWQYFLLTEDTELSAAELLKGNKAAYAPAAEFYDEQPTSFSVSWRQRMRWVKGYMEVYRRYGVKLLCGVFTKDRLAFFDACMAYLPACLLTVISILTDVFCLSAALVAGQSPALPFTYLVHTLLGAWITFFLFGVATAVKEHKYIRASFLRCALDCLTLPFFMMTYIPIGVSALFGKVEWTPIRHLGENQQSHL